MTDPVDVASVLRKVPFFAEFREDELARVAEIATRVTASPGQALFKEGEPGDSLLVLVSGQVHLTRRINGRERTLTILGRRGDAVGEMSLLAGEARPATATADFPAELLAIRREDFEGLLRRFPAMALGVTRVLSSRLVKTERSGGRIFAAVPALSPPDGLAFLANLARSLRGQSGRRVLLLGLHEREESPLRQALGLPDCPPLRQAGDLGSPEILRSRAQTHAEGFDVLCLPLGLLEGPGFDVLYPFLDAVRSAWDLTLAALPRTSSRAAKAFWEECDRTLFVREESAERGDPLWREMETVAPPHRLDLVELKTTSTPKRNRAGRFYVPWPADLGNRWGGPEGIFGLRRHSGAGRGLDRMARHLAGLRLGFAMGSGAALGYSIIGMLRVLERHGVYPDLFAGTSMGALIGSLYASGRSVDDMERIALSITKRRLWAMADLAWPWKGVVLGQEVLRFLKSLLGEVTFDQLHLPFACVATDIGTGEERVLRHGPVAEAVRASLSLPFFFSPFFHQGRYLVDGGLVNPVPTSVVKAMGAELAIAVNITTKPSKKRFPGLRAPRPFTLNPLHGPNIFQVMMKTLYTMQYGISQAGAAEADVSLSPDLSDFTWLEFHRAAEIIRIGEEITERMMPKIRALLPSLSGTMSPERP